MAAYYATLIVNLSYIDGTSCKKKNEECVHLQNGNRKQLSKQHYTLQ